jgi:hypothetical protein
MELKPLNETIGWIWPKRITIPALTLDFELATSYIHVTSESFGAACAGARLGVSDAPRGGDRLILKAGSDLRARCFGDRRRRIIIGASLRPGARSPGPGLPVPAAAAAAAGAEPLARRRRQAEPPSQAADSAA